MPRLLRRDELLKWVFIPSLDRFQAQVIWEMSAERSSRMPIIRQTWFFGGLCISMSLGYTKNVRVRVSAPIHMPSSKTTLSRGASSTIPRANTLSSGERTSTPKSAERISSSKASIVKADTPNTPSVHTFTVTSSCSSPSCIARATDSDSVEEPINK